MKDDFIKYQAQTSPTPLKIKVKKARGAYVIDTAGKKYLDFIAGVSANTLGHRPKSVEKALKKQLKKHTHVMVYGEFVQEMPIKLCKLLAENLPSNLSQTYLTNSGTEATEGALKLAKRFTGRSEMIAAKNAYHGNTQGAMSVCGKETQNRAFRPLIPGVRFIGFNDFDDLEKITQNTAAVILETIQGGAGFICPENNYLQAVKKRCEKMGALLILDEIQSGVGRTGKLYAFEHYNITPDILITGKGLGGGLPIGAFISSKKIMQHLTKKPTLGHITTFGGHPLMAAAGFATLHTLLQKKLMQGIAAKEKRFREKLNHPEILAVRGRGLMLALMMKTPEKASDLILKAKEKGLLLFWLLYEKRAVRISPPLNITDKEIDKGCNIILAILK